MENGSEYIRGWKDCLEANGLDDKGNSIHPSGGLVPLDEEAVIEVIEMDFVAKEPYLTEEHVKDIAKAICQRFGQRETYQRCKKPGCKCNGEAIVFHGEIKQLNPESSQR